MKKIKKLLIAGGGYADIPLIEASKNLGFYTITSGNRPDELGHKVSDEYCPADFSDPEAMLELGINLKIDAICACCNDFSAISSAYVAEKMGLPGHDSYEVTKRLHHKDSYREFAISHNIPTPKAEGFSDVESALLGLERLSFPVIIKPVDLTGGKGITRIDSELGARAAIQEAFSISKSKRIVVEEFIVGSRHGFSAFIRDEKVVFHFSDNEHYYLNQYMVAAASTPANVPVDAIDELISQTEKVASLLSLGTGIFHVQYILKNDSPVIIEICRRAPGDLYIKLVQHATGIDYSKWIVRAAAGLDCSLLSHKNVEGYYARHCLMADKEGVLNDININTTLEQKIVDRFTWWKQGDLIDNFLISKFGILFVKFGSKKEMIEMERNIYKYIDIDINI